MVPIIHYSCDQCAKEQINGAVYHATVSIPEGWLVLKEDGQGLYMVLCSKQCVLDAIGDIAEPLPSLRILH